MPENRVTNAQPEGMITSKHVDLSNCDREEIQYPGSIQAHGAMVVVRELDLRILQASANTLDLLGVGAETLPGGELRALLAEGDIETLQRRLAADVAEGAPVHILRRQIAGREFDLLVHRSDGVLILEFELRPAADSAVADLYSDLRFSVMKLETAANLQSFLDLAVRHVRRFTGFDRVMAYKFMEDGSGWVCAEALRDGLESFLGLHYPPSDIPAPARRLYSLTWLRHQPDIGYRPVRMIPEDNPQTGKALDMSYALLRSVSVMYVDYLKNMGTQSSMVMTLMKEGKVWGLMACHHHAEPKHVPYEVRVACEFLAHTVSLQMAAREDAEHYEYRMKMQATQTTLLGSVARHADFASGFVKDAPTLADFINSSGAACVVNGAVSTTGMAPTVAQIAYVVKWLSSQVSDTVFATDCLSAHLPGAAAFADRCAGLLALRFSKAAGDFLLWFRPEVVQTVNWAGDPSKPVETSDDGKSLRPRNSFALWKELVRLKSRPWSSVELEAAKGLRAAVLELVLERAEKLGKLYEDLELSHAELDSFAHVAAHDLKEPLRGIHTYAQILLEENKGQLDADVVSKLTTMIRLSKRMDELINSLLVYSRMGRMIAQTAVNLSEIVAEAVDSLQMRIGEEKVEVRIAADLPVVRGDRERLLEVYTNLILNAIKYNDSAEKKIEIGCRERAGTSILFVKDNGIGIDPRHHEKIFQIFQRLHGKSDYGGGTGAGLAIVKKIIDRHGGRIWVESEAGKGASFYFTFSAAATTAI